METSVEIKDNNIAVTRDGCVYLYKLLNGKYQMYSLSPDITREFSEYWDSNLLAKRDGSWNWFVDQPRKKDIIYLFEITDEVIFLDVIRAINYMEYKHLFHYTDKKYCTLIYERTDGVMEVTEH